VWQNVGPVLDLRFVWPWRWTTVDYQSEARWCSQNLAEV
jgi:hypothetical protein